MALPLPFMSHVFFRHTWRAPDRDGQSRWRHVADTSRVAFPMPASVNMTCIIIIYSLHVAGPYQHPCQHHQMRVLPHPQALAPYLPPHIPFAHH
jgi:hypothetical protein